MIWFFIPYLIEFGTLFMGPKGNIIGMLNLMKNIELRIFSQIWSWFQEFLGGVVVMLFPFFSLVTPCLNFIFCKILFIEMSFVLWNPTNF